MNRHQQELSSSPAAEAPPERVVLEGAPDPYLTTDFDGRILSANRSARARLGGAANALCGRYLGTWIAAPWRLAFDRHLKTLREATPLRTHPLALEFAGPNAGAPVKAWATRCRDDRLHWIFRDDSVQDVLRRELRDALTSLTLTEEREREGLSRDLHDDVGQLLSLASLKLARLRRRGGERDAAVSAIEDIIQTVSERVSTLTFQLHPPALYHEGLPAAIKWLADELQRSHGLDVDLEGVAPVGEISEAERVVLFRSARELLLNVAKHTRAPVARVTLHRNGGELELTVSNGGAERLADRPRRSRQGFGLASIEERVEGLGGRFETVRLAAGGTLSTLTLPLRRESARGRCRNSG